MLQRRVYLVLEFLSVYRTAAAACACGVAGLEHEVGDYAVEDYVVVVAALGEGGEILASLREGC